MSNKMYRDPRTGKVYDKISDALCDYCESVANGRCMDCVFADTDTGCGRIAMKRPDEAARRMGLEIIDEPDAAKDTNVPGKPRLAEVLGVEVGERFKVLRNGMEYDCVIGQDGAPGGTAWEVIYAINHPESIIRTPRLTEPEIAIMRAAGAKWVSMDAVEYSVQVSLWSNLPTIVDGFYHGLTDDKNYGWLGNLNASLFPCVKPGDCIELEETPSERGEAT